MHGLTLSAAGCASSVCKRYASDSRASSSDTLSASRRRASCTEQELHRLAQPRGGAARGVALQLGSAVLRVYHLARPLRHAPHVAQPRLREAQREVERPGARPALGAALGVERFALVAFALFGWQQFELPRHLRRELLARAAARIPGGLQQPVHMPTRPAGGLAAHGATHEALRALPRGATPLARQPAREAGVAEGQAGARGECLPAGASVGALVATSEGSLSGCPPPGCSFLEAPRSNT